VDLDVELCQAVVAGEVPLDTLYSSPLTDDERRDALLVIKEFLEEETPDERPD
jgi:hypothetical protein